MKKIIAKIAKQLGWKTSYHVFYVHLKNEHIVNIGDCEAYASPWLTLDDREKLKDLIKESNSFTGKIFIANIVRIG
jgi:hypothetical protein